MYLKDSLVSSVQTILTHKMRSFLTVIGIMIGVASVVSMFSSVNGLKKIIEKNIEGMGWNNSIIVVPSTSDSYGSHRRRFRFMSMSRESKGLSYEDYTRLKQTIPCKDIYGMVETWLTYQIGDKQDYTLVKATNNDFFTNKSFFMKNGNYFSHFQEKNAEKVCILGYYFSKDNYTSNPVGMKINLGNQRFTIIGVLDEDKLNRGAFDFNKWERTRDLSNIYVPLSTGAKYLMPQMKINYIYVQAHDGDSFRQLKNTVRQELLSYHNMSHDFRYEDIGATMVEVLSEFNDMMHKWNVTLTAIASISLLVGGIGLFSTLMISINERMMEIGVRKSIGASEFDIFIYFIMEALTLASMAAILGISTALFLITIIAKTAMVTFPIPVEGIILGLTFSLLIGFVSGFYPAWKASQIDPIQAIYYFE